MSDPTLSDIDYKNGMTRVKVPLKYWDNQKKNCERLLGMPAALHAIKIIILIISLTDNCSSKSRTRYLWTCFWTQMHQFYAFFSRKLASNTLKILEQPVSTKKMPNLVFMNIFGPLKNVRNVIFYEFLSEISWTNVVNLKFCLENYGSLQIWWWPFSLVLL